MSSTMTDTNTETTDTTTDAPEFHAPTLKASTLKVALQSALLAASKDTGIRALCVVQFDVEPGSVVTNSTDRYRLVRTETVPTEGSGSEGWKFSLSRTDAAMLVKALGTGRNLELPVTLTYEYADSPGMRDGRLTVQVAYGASFTFYGVEGDFPRVASLIPDTERVFTGAATMCVDPRYLGDLAKFPRDKVAASVEMTPYRGGDPAALVPTLWLGKWDASRVAVTYLLMARRPLSK